VDLTERLKKLEDVIRPSGAFMMAIKPEKIHRKRGAEVSMRIERDARFSMGWRGWRR
jgi:hypothetical protein